MIVKLKEDKHLGPRWSYGEISVSIVAAEKLEIIDALSEPVTKEYKEHLEESLIQTAKELGLQVRIKLLEIKESPVDSAPVVFIKLGRIALHVFNSLENTPILKTANTMEVSYKCLGI